MSPTAERRRTAPLKLLSDQMSKSRQAVHLLRAAELGALESRHLGLKRLSREESYKSHMHFIHRLQIPPVLDQLSWRKISVLDQLSWRN